MFLAQRSDFVDQTSNSQEFVHDDFPLFLELLYLLLTYK
jgi:hypothetical protein